MPRLTLRAEAEVIDAWHAALAITGRPPHEAFAVAVESWLAALPPEARAAIERQRRKAGKG